MVGSRKNKGKKKCDEGMPSDLHGVEVKTVDLSSLIPSPIYNQGENNPVCWAIAFAGATEAMVNRNRHDDKWRASPQELMDDFLTDEQKLHDKHMPTRVSVIWIHILKYGLSQTKDYPCEKDLRPMLDRDIKQSQKVPASKVPASKVPADQVPADQVPARQLLRIGAYQEVSNQRINENKLLKRLTTQPVVAAVRPYRSFCDFRGDGIYRGPTEAEKKQNPPSSLHDVILVGFGSCAKEDGTEEHFFRCRNSQGTVWGAGGYGKILRQVSFDKVKKGKMKGKEEPPAPSLIIHYTYPTPVESAQD